MRRGGEGIPEIAAMKAALHHVVNGASGMMTKIKRARQNEIVL